MILVLPFCAKDGELAIKNLEWIRELNPTLPYDCILSWDDATPASMINRMRDIATPMFKRVIPCFYPAPEKRYWPAAANCAFQNAARFVAYYHPKAHWLFLEPDATPIRSGWLDQLEAEYQKGGKPFMAHVVDGMGHPNGVMVYPYDVAAFSQDAMRVEETAWDVVLGATVEKSQIHPANEIIRHCWNMDEKTGDCTNGHGISPTFKSVHDVVRRVDLNAALFHRCKDGTLIQWLRELYRAPHKAMVPQHTNDEEPTNDRAQDVRRDDPVASGADSKPADSAQLPRAEVVDHPSQVPFEGKCEIFIVTYGLPTKRVSGQIVSDFDWLTWCLRGIRRHCSGFAGVTLAIPDRDAAMLQGIANEHGGAKKGLPLRIKMYKEKLGKGHIQHMALMASAEEFIPKETTHVLHVDADTVFKESVTPDEYFYGTKPVYVWRTYDSLAEVRDGQKVVSDCIQWKEPTEKQLGFQVQAYTMCRLPVGFPVGFYPKYRKHIEGVHKKPFFDYMLSGRNEFPPNRLDFTAFGAYAFAFMKDDFHWIDISGGNHLAPRDKSRTFWSHGGLNPHIEKEIQDLLK